MLIFFIMQIPRTKYLSEKLAEESTKVKITMYSEG